MLGKRTFSQVARSPSSGVHYLSKDKATVVDRNEEVLPRTTENSPSNGEISALENSSKRARQVFEGHNFGLKRATDQLAAPGGIPFDAAEILALLGINAGSTELTNAIQIAKTALNDAGPGLQQRRDRATKIIAALTCLQEPFASLKKLESLPEEPDSNDNKDELTLDTLSLQRKLKLLSMICEKEVAPFTAHRLILEKEEVQVREATQEVEKQYEAAKDDIARAKVELEAKKLELEKKVESLKSIDSAIQSVLEHQNSTTNVGLTSILDALSSQDKTITRMMDRRRESMFQEKKTRNELEQANSVLEFAETVAKLVIAVKRTYEAKVNLSLSQAAAHRQQVLDLCTTSLQESIPKFGETIVSLLKSHQERQRAAQLRVDKKAAALQSHIELFGDEAPEERQSMERKVKEFKAIVIRSQSAVESIADEIEQCFRHLLLVSNTSTSHLSSKSPTNNGVKQEPLRDPEQVDLTREDTTDINSCTKSLAMVPAKVKPNTDLPLNVVTTIENVLRYLEQNISYDRITMATQHYLSICQEIRHPTKHQDNEDVESKEEDDDEPVSSSSAPIRFKSFDRFAVETRLFNKEHSSIGEPMPSSFDSSDSFFNQGSVFSQVNSKSNKYSQGGRRYSRYNRAKARGSSSSDDNNDLPMLLQDQESESKDSGGCQIQ